MDLLIVLLKYFFLFLFTVANSELQYWSRVLIKELVSKVAVVIPIYSHSRIRLNSLAIVVLLVC